MRGEGSDGGSWYRHHRWWRRGHLHQGRTRGSWDRENLGGEVANYAIC